MAERRGGTRPALRWRVLLAVTLGGCTAASPESRVEVPVDSAAGEVKFALEGPGGAALVVPVMINGQGPFDFVLDTGATLTCIDQRLARRLELEEERGVRGIGAGMGAAGRISLVRLDSLRIGQARASELMACALDLRHTESVGLGIDGLIGLNFLKSYRVTVDFQREVLLLQAP